MLQVTKKTPIDAEERPFLHAWDTSARLFHRNHELRKSAVSEIVKDLKSNFFTSFRTPIQLRDRYSAADAIALRQQLGEISKAEVREVNKVQGGATRFTLARSEPALLHGWNSFQAAVFLGVGTAFGVYGKFARGYNILWLPASIVPVSVYLAFSYARQPTQRIENAYRYILAKRIATAEFEANQARIASQPFAQTAEYA